MASPSLHDVDASCDYLLTMAVYGSIPVKLVTYTTVGITTTTIFLCYALAVGLGHVPAWLPMISDCAVESPEKYPFRLGIISGATALIANVLLVYSAFPSFSLRKTSAAFGVVASVGLAIVGAVNEEEDNTVHSGMAHRPLIAHVPMHPLVFSCCRLLLFVLRHLHDNYLLQRTKRSAHI